MLPSFYIVPGKLAAGPAVDLMAYFGVIRLFSAYIVQTIRGAKKNYTPK
jgi:hypothetical protein